jgi:exonuclease SbcC
MKILGLSFANLNSLEGRWEIDFTRPEYVSDGIFAIIGPTGSGKSTILDALCLALYGQTPRLGKITKSSNELMSRHAGECFAEVTFSTARGTFRCHWSQHRSRRRAGGELQAQKHELSDSAGNILHSKIQDTLAGVEELTGMDFERFTRSMLLAQGGFAAFLQADPDRRAPVLEQITGTEVYSLISMRVHERQRAERLKLEQLRVETESLRVLDAETLAALQSRLENLIGQEQHVRIELDSACLTRRRLDEIARFEAELEALELEGNLFKADMEAFAPQEAMLALALGAASLEPRYAPLDHQRRELGREISELSAKESHRPALEEASMLADERLAMAVEALEAATGAEALARPLHEQVASLDRQMSEKRRSLDTLRQELDAQAGRIGRHDEERAAVACTLDNYARELDGLESWLEANCTDAALASGLSGIRHAVDELRRAVGTRDAITASVATAVKARQECLDAKSACEPASEASRARLAASIGERDRLSGELGALLDGRSLKTLRLELQASGERRQLLEEIAALYVSGKELAPKMEAVAEEMRVKSVCREDARARLGHARELLQLAEREAALVEENLRLMARVRSYEEERTHLIDGIPCPLCGSSTHPWSNSTPDLPGQDDDAVSRARDAVRLHATTVNELEILIAQCTAGIGQLELRLAELAADREQYGRRCLSMLGQAGIADRAREAEPAVIRECSIEHDRAAGLARLVEAAEVLDERVRQAETDRQSSLEACTVDVRRLEQAEERFSAASSELRRLEDAADGAYRELERIMEVLHSLLAPIGVSLDSEREADAILETLGVRCERWRGGEVEALRLREAIITHQARLSGLSEQMATMVADRAGKLEAVTAVNREIELLAARRTGLFGDRDPVAEGGKIADATTAARDLLEDARQAAARCSQELRVVDTAITAHREGISKRRTLVDSLEAAFLEELHAKGFRDEPAFLGACLPEGERDRLQKRAEELLRRRQDLDARRNDRARRIRDGQAEISDTRTPEMLAKAIPELEEAVRTLLEQIGAIRQQLAENELVAVEQREKAAAIEAQASECRRWELLHELVGSADGKKFRNFAQGLTFEVMVSHANRQLAFMTDRYQLVRDPYVPLELNVIDTWQAGEVRSTRNLSGGESFIVSLALALGLSQMSSRNVRVDSLFLDEGFGTLDKESLETALETLAGLQQSGKLIGIISHVPALKERISTQIQVTPLTGGRSAISGPGTFRR